MFNFVNFRKYFICSASAISMVTSLSACGGGGGGGGTTTNPGGSTDSTSPRVTFTPSSVSLSSGATASSVLAATDNVGVTSGPTVSCTAGSFANGVFTAPVTTVDVTATCTATASDAAGNRGTATLTANISGVDTQAPTLSFSPATLTVTSGGTASTTLTATDNVGITSGPTVTCSTGTFENGIYTAPVTETDVTDVCTATASDAAGNRGTATLTANINGVPTSGDKVTLNGKITYDSVPHNTATNGLDYANTVRKPARGITIEALDSSGNVLASTVTDSSGDYTMELTGGQNVQLRAKAELVETSTPGWNVKVTDNTSSNALYALTGSLAALGSSTQTRNLHANSGWGSTSYTSTRAAAPFAILDPIYEAIIKFTAIDSSLVLPAVEFRWSVNNTSSLIGTSSYSQGNIAILGDADTDTDEYDSHVIVHEWGHYFQDKISRDSSIGGSHSAADRLDPRIAFSEGWGNALSGMILEDPIYRDSLGTRQSQGFSVDVEGNSYTNEGWFNEGSVQSIFYDIYDDVSDGADTLSAGLGPIYQAMTSSDFLNSPYLTTVFNFIDSYKNIMPGDAAALDGLLTAQSINGTGIDGSGETNDGSISSSLPLYKSASVNGGATEVCSVDDAGNQNKLGNWDFVYVDLPSAGDYTLTVARKSGTSNRDPDFYVYQGDTLIGGSEDEAVDTETATLSLPAGGVVVAVRDYLNGDTPTLNNGDSCYNFTITN